MQVAGEGLRCQVEELGEPPPRLVPGVERFRVLQVTDVLGDEAGCRSIGMFPREGERGLLLWSAGEHGGRLGAGAASADELGGMPFIGGVPVALVPGG